MERSGWHRLFFSSFCFQFFSSIRKQDVFCGYVFQCKCCVCFRVETSSQYVLCVRVFLWQCVGFGFLFCLAFSLSLCLSPSPPRPPSLSPSPALLSLVMFLPFCYLHCSPFPSLSLASTGATASVRPEQPQRHPPLPGMLQDCRGLRNAPAAGDTPPPTCPPSIVRLSIFQEIVKTSPAHKRFYRINYRKRRRPSLFSGRLGG